MADANAINNLSRDLTIRPSSAGDMFIQFNLGGTDKFIIGVDDSDSDSFKISQGGALGTNDTFIVTAAGEITQPLQPAFLGVLESNENSTVGGGTHTVGTTTAFTEIFDQNSNFNTNGTFTAPVTGRYMLIGHITIGGTLTTITLVRLRVTTSNRNYFDNTINANAAQDVNNELSIQATVIADMDANDTCTWVIDANGTANVANVIGTATGTSNVTYVCGYLAV